jgi:hypothetical protein
LNFNILVNPGAMKTEQVIDFLKHVQRHMKGKRFIVWDAWLPRQRVDYQGKFKREPMIRFRSSDKVGQVRTSRAKTGSEIFCESPCESGLASG